MKKIFGTRIWGRVALVAALLMGVRVGAMAQSTWKLVGKEHVVAKGTEEKMGGVMECQLPEKTVTKEVTVGLAQTGQEAMLAELFADGGTPRLYAAIFFKEPTEKGAQLYQKVKEKGDRQLARKGDKQTWVTPLDGASQRTLTYAFTAADHAQAEFWLVTAVGYGDNYQQGAAWDVLHYMRGSGKKNTNGYPLFDDPEWYSYEKKETDKTIEGAELPHREGEWEGAHLRYDTKRKDIVLQTFSHHKDYPKTLLQEDHYTLTIANQPNFIGADYEQTEEHEGFYYKEKQYGKNKDKDWVEWKAKMGWSGTHDYFTIMGEGNWYAPPKSMELIKRYWLPVFKKESEYEEAQSSVKIHYETTTCFGYPALTLFWTHHSTSNGWGWKREVCTDIKTIIFTDIPQRTDISLIKWLITRAGGTAPDNLNDIVGQSCYTYDFNAYCCVQASGEFEHDMETYYNKAYAKMQEIIKHYEETVKIKVDHQRTVLVDDYYVTEGTVPDMPKDTISIDSLERINPEELSEKEIIAWMDKLVGWLKGDNDLLGEHTSGMESAAISLIGMLLAALLGSGGGGMPMGGGGGSVPPSDPETERLKELDRRQGEKWLKEQRDKNQAQWDKEREIGEQKAREREAAKAAQEKKDALMKKLAKEFNTDDEEKIMKELKKRTNDLQTLADKDQMTATLWNIATWGTWGIEKVCDITINTMGEVVPGGKAVKNGYTLLKAPLKRFAEVMEADSRGAGLDVKTALYQGTIEGLIGVVQNEAGAFSKSLGGWGEMAAVVGGESAKAALASYIQGGNASDIVGEAAKAGAQKSIYYGIGKGMSGLGNVKKDAEAAPIIKRINDLQIKKLDLLKEGNIKEAVKVMQERGDTMRELAKTGRLADLFTTKYSVLSQEGGAEFVTNPLVDVITEL